MQRQASVPGGRDGRCRGGRQFGRDRGGVTLSDGGPADNSASDEEAVEVRRRARREQGDGRGLIAAEQSLKDLEAKLA
eukprot:3201775-Pleurochrysis_carterae.AAC.1